MLGVANVMCVNMYSIHNAQRERERERVINNKNFNKLHLRIYIIHFMHFLVYIFT